MKRFDLQDTLLLVGIISIVSGVRLWSVPAALVVFGLFCLVGVAGIARSRAVKGNKLEGNS